MGVSLSLEPKVVRNIICYDVMVSVCRWTFRRVVERRPAYQVSSDVRRSG